MFDLILEGATVLLPEGQAVCDIGITDGKISAIGSLHQKAAKKTWKVNGLHILPGVIDTQVHFREPGLEYKEDLESGTRGAVLGGVTGVFEMPNTKPPTTSAEALDDKLSRANGRAWCDYAFYVGATSENTDSLGELERRTGVCGIKIFMGSSTGSLLMADEADLEKVLRSGKSPVAVHAEDESRLQERKAEIPNNATAAYHPIWRDDLTALTATQKIVALSAKTGRAVHVLHISSQKEMEFLVNRPPQVSVETLPQFLSFFGPDIYEKIGTRAQMNPPIRFEADRQSIWKALLDGTVDILGTDHAPHTKEEKARPYPQSPSGMPGVQTLVPVMLTHVVEGRLSLARFVELTNGNVKKRFGLKNKGEIAIGRDADLTIVDLKRQETIRDSWMATKCGWTPFDGWKAKGWPVGTIIRGQVVMQEGALVGTPVGKPIEFLRD